LEDLTGHVFDVLEVSKPISAAAAVNLSKIVSKLSPLLGNLIEFNTVEFLNKQEDFSGVGKWRRQDPGFPDTVFDGVSPTPGFEIKAWFPLATEITARFKDSQAHFIHDNTYVCMLAWLPEHIIYGKPYILDVVVVSGRSVAKARDNHYHNPPFYVVREPEDTTARTINLQQTNTNGYRIQTADSARIAAANKLIASWGANGKAYSPDPAYQDKLKELMALLTFRLDTNYAKMDRIVHTGLEKFKARVMGTKVHGLTIAQWDRLFRSAEQARKALTKAVLLKSSAPLIARFTARVADAEARLAQALKDRLGITEADPTDLLE
jgi:hypothetical protein